MLQKKRTSPVCGGVQGWEETDVSDTLNAFDNTELRTPVLVLACDVYNGTVDNVAPTMTAATGGEHKWM